MEAKRLISKSLNKIRLRTVKQREPYLLFKNILGFTPKDTSLYEMALRHRSASLKAPGGERINNERLEFLGDSVLNVVVTDYLYQMFPNLDEDFLTRTRSKIVQRKTLNRIALQLGLDKMLLSTAFSQDVNHVSVYGNAFEALIGAIYLDKGYAKCKHFLEHSIIEKYIDIQKIAKTEQNFKSLLLEYCQQQKIEIEFKTEERDVSTDKSERFISQIFINQEMKGEGFGMSKKEAQQKASKLTLIQFNQIQEGQTSKL
jgi:ribonuclease III